MESLSNNFNRFLSLTGIKEPQQDDPQLQNKSKADLRKERLIRTGCIALACLALVAIVATIIATHGAGLLVLGGKLSHSALFTHMQVPYSSIDNGISVFTSFGVACLTIYFILLHEMHKQKEKEVQKQQQKLMQGIDEVGQPINKPKV